MKALRNENGGGAATDEMFSGRIGADTRFELRITGPLDGACMDRLIKTLEAQRSAIGHPTAQGATAK